MLDTEQFIEAEENRFIEDDAFADGTYDLSKITAVLRRAVQHGLALALEKAKNSRITSSSLRDDHCYKTQYELILSRIAKSSEKGEV